MKGRGNEKHGRCTYLWIVTVDSVPSFYSRRWYLELETRLVGCKASSLILPNWDLNPPFQLAQNAVLSFASFPFFHCPGHLTRGFTIPVRFRGEWLVKRAVEEASKHPGSEAKRHFPTSGNFVLYNDRI